MNPKRQGVLDMPAPDVATVRGTLGRIVWRDAQDRFAIAQFKGEDGHDLTIKGPLWGLQEGEAVQLWGRMEQDPRYGPQFRVQQARPALPATATGVMAYLRSGRFPGIGATLAQRVVDVLGPTALQRLRDDPALLGKVKGLPKSKRSALLEALQVHADAEATWLFLHDLGLGPALTQKVQQRWGVDAVRKVRDDPFRLAEDIAGIGFRTADGVARALGTPDDAPGRLRAGLTHTLNLLADQGHTAAPSALVRQRAAEVLAVPEAVLDAALVQATATGKVRQIGDTLARPALAEAELRLADALQRVRQASRPIDADVEGRLALATQALGFTLEGRQRLAVATGLHAGLLVVTGGPGTGKTTIVRGLLAALQPDRPRVLLAAPTGRAARRLAEATGHEAKTLHRLLEFDPRQDRFLRDADRQLEADLVLVDEASMLDVPLADALLQALPPGARLLLVGDAEQLPSVGPGAVLHDLIAADVAPVVALDRIWRQGEGSRIAWAAWQVRHGQLPDGGKAHDGGDFFVVARESAEAIARTVLEIVARRLPALGFHPLDDVQVLAPMHKGPLGTQALNELLRDALNPHGAPVGLLRVGDKVLQTRNDYDLDVFNGDVGRVVGSAQIGLPGEPLGVRVRFGEREVDVPASRVEQLQLAYAVTVHKAQGSEYPAVVLPLHAQHHLLLQRNLLYTALTRGRRFSCVVGQLSALEHAVHNDAPIHRFTLLARALCGAT